MTNTVFPIYVIEDYIWKLKGTRYREEEVVATLIYSVNDRRWQLVERCRSFLSTHLSESISCRKTKRNKKLGHDSVSSFLFPFYLKILSFIWHKK